MTEQLELNFEEKENTMNFTEKEVAIALGKLDEYEEEHREEWVAPPVKDNLSALEVTIPCSDKGFDDIYLQLSNRVSGIAYVRVRNGSQMLTITVKKEHLVEAVERLFPKE